MSKSEEDMVWAWLKAAAYAGNRDTFNLAWAAAVGDEEALRQLIEIDERENGRQTERD